MSTYKLSRPLVHMPYAQAQVVEFADGHKRLVSYVTTVAEITADGWLYIHGLYSATTRRHIGCFMRELGLDYQTAKALYLNNYKMNIHTGEVKSVDED